MLQKLTHLSENQSLNLWRICWATLTQYFHRNTKTRVINIYNVVSLI